MDDTSRRMSTDVADTRGLAGGTSGEADERTKQIRDEIEETRGEMTDTIDAIQEKLRPGNIVANATERVKTATTERVREMAGSASDAAQQAVDYTRETAARVAGNVGQNQMPLALIAVGAAWWLTNRSRNSSQSFGRNGGRDYGRSHAMTDYQSGGYERDAGSRLNMGSGARQPGSAESMRGVVRRRKNQLQRTVEQNPLLVGAGALLLGAAFGLAIPETEAENELMGEARDTVFDRARDLARDAGSQVQDAATMVAENVVKSAVKLQS
jgi:hypothetical protein